MQADLTAHCDADCVLAGTKWSTLYTLNAITMALITAQAIALAVGVYNMWTRVYSCMFQCFFCGFNLGAFIYSGVLRFNTKGSLAAIS